MDPWIHGSAAGAAARAAAGAAAGAAASAAAVLIYVYFELIMKVIDTNRHKTLAPIILRNIPCNSRSRQYRQIKKGTGDLPLAAAFV